MGLKNDKAFSVNHFAGMVSFPQFSTKPAPTQPPPNGTGELFMSTEL